MSMPKTKFLTNDPLTRKRWGKELFRVILPDIEYNALVGTGTDAAIQLKTDLGKGQGDELTEGIILPLVGEGIVGRDTVEGNEEQLRLKDFKFRIEELNHAVDTGGTMDEQRVPYNLMQEGKTGLQAWWSGKLSDILINHMVGNSAYRVAGKTFAQNPTEPDSEHHLLVNDAVNESALTEADEIDLLFLDRMKQRAEVPLHDDFYRIRTFNKGGKPYYRVLMHPYVFARLRRNTNIGEWGDLLRAAGKLGLPEVQIEYNGMLISTSERIPAMTGNKITGGVFRTILFGPQACCFGWGGAGESKSTVMSFVPYTKDAGRYVMIRGGGIFGVKKTVFNGRDFSIITGSSWGSRLE